MKKLILVALALLLVMPAATVMAQHGGGHGGGGSHGGGSHGGGSGGGGSHGGGSHGGGWHANGSHGGGGWHGGGGHGGWHGGGHYYYGYPGYYGYPWGWGWGWGAGWGWGYGPYGFFGYYGPYGYGGAQNGYVNAAEWTIVSTDVSPEEARVFLDGRYIGIADDFDGHPDYLYLRQGTYSLEFRLEGYETVALTIDARPGTKVNPQNKLKKIPGAKQYGSYETPPVEGGLQRHFGKKSDGTDEVLQYSPDDRSPNDVDLTPDEQRQPPPPPRGHGGSDIRDEEWRQSKPRHGARLLMMVKPADAAVYLDDRFIGTAEEVGGVDQAVPLAPGKHTVTVSRPGYKDKTVEVDVLAGEVKRVDVALEK